MIILVPTGLSGRHLSTLLLSRAGIEKSMLIENKANLLALTSHFQGTNLLASASFVGWRYLCGSP